MADSQLHTLLDGGDFFESPRWRDGRWFVSDFFAYHVLAVDPAGRAEEVLVVAGQPSGIGWMAEGSMLVVSMIDQVVLRRYPDGRVVTHADLAGMVPGHLNDMVVDHFGRAYVGNIGFDVSDWDADKADALPATVLMRVDPDGTITEVASDLHVPNGTVITPDGRTLIIGEALGARYTAFTVNDDGALSERRTWPQLARPIRHRVRTAVRLTPTGSFWMADPVAGVCRRLAPGGQTRRSGPRPPAGMSIFACMLGGDDGRTLLLCAAPDFAEVNRMAAREAVLLTTTVDVPHGGLP